MCSQIVSKIYTRARWVAIDHDNRAVVNDLAPGPCRRANEGKVDEKNGKPEKRVGPVDAVR